ncbi:hypothetical protein QKW35_10200 [Pontibacterium granulatum]|uniref:hypothetical protein n=1 Tax=Pontibacterium granulatum TaxID=2036029 RepID=UPI00249BF2A3|nr:hypothetical protein [Pontibacterium granulatum]MDI3324747.1 hypothetical protein [Pontibacterium granulatum]
MINRILVFALIAFGATGLVFDLESESLPYFVNAVALFIAIVILDFTVNPLKYISSEETDDE